MSNVAEIQTRRLPIDPQPRKDLEVPPLVTIAQPEGVSSVKAPEVEQKETKNIFSGLSFKPSD